MDSNDAIISITNDNNIIRVTVVTDVKMHIRQYANPVQISYDLYSIFYFQGLLLQIFVYLISRIINWVIINPNYMVICIIEPLYWIKKLFESILLENIVAWRKYTHWRFLLNCSNPVFFVCIIIFNLFCPLQYLWSSQ